MQCTIDFTFKDVKSIVHLISESVLPRIAGSLEISNSLNELRKDRGLTQHELADAVGVTRATIIALEKGSYNPSLELAFRLSRFFKTGIEGIFFEKGTRRD
jgi:putative transcriptional regulator